MIRIYSMKTDFQLHIESRGAAPASRVVMEPFLENMELLTTTKYMDTTQHTVIISEAITSNNQY